MSLKIAFALIITIFVVAALTACGASGPTPTQVGSGVRDCTACVNDTAPIITKIFGSCAKLDGGAD